MISERPLIRFFLACHAVQKDAASGDTNLHRLIHTIRPMAGSGFPLVIPKLDLFGFLSNGRGTHEFAVRFTKFGQEGDIIILSTRSHTVDLGEDPLKVRSLRIPMKNVEFETPGDYTFHLLCDGQEIASVALTAKGES